MNADFSSTSFRVSRVSIGARNFLGNNIAFPSGARMGDNCLLATKVMVPIDGDVREGVGLLGSPCFEIPRSVQRDSQFDHLKSQDELPRRLAAKNKYNAITMGVFLLVRWIYFFGLTLLALVNVDLYERFGASMIAIAIVLPFVFSIAYFVLVERAATGFRAMSPQYCSIYEPYYWWHERFWKMIAPLKSLNGTPFKSVIWRLLGVRLGRKVFDDGCDIPEKTLATIGNNCTLNAGSVIQCHSLEDGTFKSDYTTIGADCTLGLESFVHYGVTMGDGAVLDADSFLMKGEEIAPHARWRGNPAREIRDVSPVGPAAAPFPVTSAPATTRELQLLLK
jgi:non-ribosomal peptide synthetase-like protein